MKTIRFVVGYMITGTSLLLFYMFEIICENFVKCGWQDDRIAGYTYLNSHSVKSSSRPRL